MRILVIDDSSSFREFIRGFFNRKWENTEVDEYDPLLQGKPDADFDLSHYDILLLDYELGLADETGLDWLQSFKQRSDIPITIMLTGEADHRTAISLARLDPEHYANKPDLREDGLILSINEALVSHRSLSNYSGDPAELLLDGNNQDDITRLMSPNEIAGLREFQYERTYGPDLSRLQIPGYRILSKIAKGGMSSVVLAQRLEDDLQVVLKVLFTESCNDPKALKRFMQEYTLIGQVRHPNVVRIYERAFARDYAYIAMEYFQGGDLNQRMKETISHLQAVDYLRQIAEGLHQVHQFKIVHRDLKPGNILFRNDHSLTITDFGVAKVLRGPSEITDHNTVLGTPYYMSPEQANGIAINHRSDLYSVGVIFYQMLTGKRPYTAETIAGLVYKHVHAPIPRLPARCARYQALIDGLLAKNPEDRFQSAGDLITGIDWILSSGA
jgi:tRNA A-37 threonylcarbamoyl transferase component Bud32/DNA-binding NarL/FixJ family response regulator